MSEPSLPLAAAYSVSPTVSAVSLMTLFVAVFGPNFGPYLVIILSSVGGGFWALGSTPTANWRAGIWVLTRCTLTAVIFTATVSVVVGPKLNLPPVEVYAGVAFVIGMLGNQWLQIIAAIKARVIALITTSGADKESQK